MAPSLLKVARLSSDEPAGTHLPQLCAQLLCTCPVSMQGCALPAARLHP